MSLAGDRREIADALSAIDDVRGHKYRPRTLPAGAAWPLLDGLDRAANDFAATWRIVVILPPDEQAASEWFDAHHEQIADGLAYVGVVERIEPGLVDTDAGDLPAMILTVRREA